MKEKTGMVLLFNQNSLQNMMSGNNAIRNGLLHLLDGKTAKYISYNWIGWLLSILALADLFNHLRLFRSLPFWVQKATAKNRLWLWVRLSIGILLPLLVIFGLPLVIKFSEGGSPSWIEPLRLMPDLTCWLLLGMILNLLRNLLKVILLFLRQKQLTERIQQ